MIIKVKQGEAFLVKALKTEYNFVREEVVGERYYQLSCTRQASVSVKLTTPGKRGRPAGSWVTTSAQLFPISTSAKPSWLSHPSSTLSPHWPISKQA